MNLIQYVGNVLAPIGISVQWEIRTVPAPCITYHFYNESGELYGEGQAKTESTACQIDIWSKSDYTNIKKQAKSLMKDAGFLLAGSDGFFEQEANVYHCILIFNYYYRTEEEG